MKIGGPIEALCLGQPCEKRAAFPPMKIGGPIEAGQLLLSRSPPTLFPPMKIGGPIEADLQPFVLLPCCGISADENRRPH